MLSIGWVIFFKSAILTAWTVYKEDRDKRLNDGREAAWRDLVARFQSEWNRRCAEQPRALPRPQADRP